jgi:hypothetical protein
MTRPVVRQHGPNLFAHQILATLLGQLSAEFSPQFATARNWT